MEIKKVLKLLLVLLAVGFAAVATNLIITGNAMFAVNDDDFDVYFSKAFLDSVDKSDSIISTDGKSIVYEINNLKLAGDTSVLTYEVTNNSSHYDADIAISCDFDNNDYIRVDNTLNGKLIKAKSVEEGTLTVSLIKSAVDVKEIILSCSIDAIAVERELVEFDPVVEGESKTYSLYGYLVDQQDNDLENVSVVAFSEPQYTISRDDGYIYLENLDKGSHTLYVLNNYTIEQLKKLSEEEIKTAAITSTNFTTSSLNIVFQNGYRVSNSVIEKTKTLNVNFDADGGKVDLLSKDVIRGLFYGELPNVTKDGYTFIGWYDEENNLINEKSVVTATTSHKLIAKWQANEYEITFNANNGYIDENEVVKKVMYDDVYGELPEATRVGYIFRGWRNAEGNLITTDTVVKILDNIILSAVWENDVVEVSFDPNGGQTSVTAEIVVFDKSYGDLPTASRTGYIFNGWYDDNNRKIESSTIVSDANGHTLKAGWTPITYIVAYNANNGTGTMNSVTHTYDVSKGLTSNTMTRTGYTFKNWNTKADGSGTTYANGATVNNLSSTNNATVTLYAQWTAITYTVAYNGNGHTSGSTASSTHTYDAAKALTANGYKKAYTVTYNANGGSVSTASATASYTFSGWATSASGSVVHTDKKSVTNLSSTKGATVTLYAKWTGGKLASLPTPTRTGYTFKGWFTATSGGTQITTSTVFSANQTIYAQWTAITYTVAYNGNGHTSGSTASSTHTYDAAKALTANGYKKAYTVTYNANGGSVSTAKATASYTFSGWATSASGSVAHTDKKSVTNLSSTNGATVTLYAKWTGGKLASLPTPTRTGYTFKGWFTATSGGTQITTSTVFSANQTIYAQWTAITYKVAYNANGGSGTMSTVTHTYDTAKNLTSNTFTRTGGYTFKNWNTAANGSGTTYANGASVKNLSSTNNATVTLYAQWTPPYTISSSMACATYTANYPNSTSAYTTMYVPTNCNGGRVTIRVNKPIKVGDKIQVTWSATRSGSYYFSINDNQHVNKNVDANGTSCDPYCTTQYFKYMLTSQSRITQTVTAIYNTDYYELSLIGNHASYYAYVYVYGITLNGVQIF